ncbi:MAG: P-loop NTPase [Candidatus Omnitrophica bacterium]|nr:P-loop NTPase [Candidatus Omnitrophota bacterium]
MSGMLPGVKKAIAVAAGKGGVGGSTVSANLSLALAQKGHRVGLLDGNIYAPGVPRLFGLGKGADVSQGERIIPPVKFGIQVMSMGLLAPGSGTIIWRGPMADSLLQKLLEGVYWDNVDYLIIDLPSGTGQTQATLTQSAVLEGAIIVTTPQQASLVDSRRELQALSLARVPIIGLVENMSYYICPSCNEHVDLFGVGGGEREARALGIPFLGGVPVVAEQEMQATRGEPVVSAKPDSAVARAFLELSCELLNALERMPSGGYKAKADIDWQG